MNTLLTLDYELYNGETSGTVINCLIKPTNELCRVLTTHSFRAVFFVDTCFLNRIRELKKYHPELEKDWQLIVSQLKELHKQGHELQLHLHPNWFRATYDEGVWHPVTDDYKLSDMCKDEVDKMFLDGISLLEEISGKKPIAFRAGAYCLQTLKGYDKLFAKHGIKIDSSVFRHKKAISSQWEWYDYTNIPGSYKYRFENDVTSENVKGRFVEVSIPSYVLTKKYWKANHNIDSVSSAPWGDGKSSLNGAFESLFKRLCKKVKYKLTPQLSAASIDRFNALYLHSLFEIEELKKTDYFLIMGHPKCLSPLSLHMLDDFFVKYARRINNVVISDYSKG